MSNQKSSPTQQKSSGGNYFAWAVIILCFLAALAIYNFVMGDPSNFEGGNIENHPVNEGIRKWLGTIYKGGVIVPVLMTLLLLVLTFTIERLITLNRASGSSSADGFLRKVKTLLASNNINGAQAECDKQKGSLANVVRSTLGKYKEVENDSSMDKEQKVLALQKELEEATSLELPMLEKNLVFLATIASVATLVGLLGTVIGMIKAFAGLSTAGAPDSTALATGISEALINTALGIGTSAIAIIAYNLFTTKIDKMSYSIDEAGFSIVQQFAASHSSKS